MVQKLYAFATFISLVLLLLTTANSQASADNIRFKHFGQQQGLSQEAVFDIIQDNQGYLWFATQEGLNRYDGYQFKVFYHDLEQRNSLSNDAIYTMIKDAKGQLWLGTHGGGLNRFDPKTERFKRYSQQKHGLASDNINVVFEDKNRVLWVGTDGGGLNRFNPFKQKFEVFTHQADNPDSLNNNHVRAIAQDHQGQLWIGTDQGLNLFHPKTASFSHFNDVPQAPEALKSHSIRTILADSQARLWVGSYQSGLTRINPNGEFKQYQHSPNNTNGLCHNRVRDILENASGQIWIATDEGLCQLRPQNDQFYQFKHDGQDRYSISDNRGLSLFQDTGGVMWFGTFGGINKWQASDFAHHRHDPNQPKKLSSNIVTAFAQHPQGKIWIGSYNGLNLYDPQTSQTKRLELTGLSDKRIMSLHHDSNNNLWIGTRGQGVFIYNLDSQSINQLSNQPNNPQSLNGNGITAIFEDNSGQIWVAAYGGGLNRYHQQQNHSTGYFSHYTFDENNPNKPNSLSSNRILSIYQTQDGLMYLGTEGGGLNQFNPKTEQFKHFLHNKSQPNSLSSNIPWSITEGPQGDLWIGTWGGGLNRWRQSDRQAGLNKFSHYSKKQGLPSATIYNVLATGPKLWLSTNRGLIRFDVKAQSYKRFDHSHGLQGNEFNLNAAIKSPQGQLFFGGSNGFNAFYPNQIQPNQHQPQVVLTGIQKLNKSTGTVAVNHNQPTFEFGYQDYAISFDFAGLDYSASDKNRYQYQLEGFDQNWIDIGKSRRTTFTNLPADDYIFRVKAANNDGIWSEQGLAIKVRITPPPWRTWWAYSLYALMLLAVIYIYLRRHNHKLQEKARYSRHLEQQVSRRTEELTVANQKLAVAKAAAEAGNRAKGTFIATMSHELRTPMTAIIGFAESIQEDIAQRNLNQSECERRLGKILRNAGHLLQLMNDILDISKIEVNHLNVETIEVKPVWILQEVDELIGQQARLKGLSFDIDYQSTMPQQINTDPTRLKQILLNLCNNAIKFTEKGGISIVVKADSARNTLHFSVNDTGIGIPKDKQSCVFDAFSQADSSTTRKFGGTGLGLSISKQLCQAMGGEMGLASDIGKGSQFSFFITMGENKPQHWLQDGEQIEQFCQQRHDIAFSVPSLSGHILLAEDWADNQELIQMYIERTGATVTLVENGEQAVEKALIETFDMILMDVQMPEVDGIEATEVLRATGFSKPIVALTANVSATDIEQYLATGFTSHLSKPIEREAFYQCLANILPASSDASMNASTNAETDPAKDSQYLALVANFVTKLPKIMTQIELAVTQQDWQQLQALIHNLKGLGGSFGFPQITNLADPMYIALENGAPEQALEQLDQLRHEANLINDQDIGHAA